MTQETLCVTDARTVVAIYFSSLSAGPEVPGDRPTSLQDTLIDHTMRHDCCLGAVTIYTLLNFAHSES
jgi:hypothetical protein